MNKSFHNLIYNKISYQIIAQAYHQVMTQVNILAADKLWSQLHNRLYNQVREQIKDQIKDQVNSRTMIYSHEKANKG